MIMIVSRPKDLSAGRSNIYHLANKVTDVNVFCKSAKHFTHVCVSEFRLKLGFVITTYISDKVLSLAFQTTQFCEETRMGLAHRNSCVCSCVCSRFYSAGIAVYVHDCILQEQLCMFMTILYRNSCVCSSLYCKGIAVYVHDCILQE